MVYPAQKAVEQLGRFMQAAEAAEVAHHSGNAYVLNSVRVLAKVPIDEVDGLVLALVPVATEDIDQICDVADALVPWFQLMGLAVTRRYGSGLSLRNRGLDGEAVAGAVTRALDQPGCEVSRLINTPLEIVVARRCGGDLSYLVLIDVGSGSHATGLLAVDLGEPFAEPVLPQAIVRELLGEDTGFSGLPSGDGFTVRIK